MPQAKGGEYRSIFGLPLKQADISFILCTYIYASVKVLREIGPKKRLPYDWKNMI